MANQSMEEERDRLAALRSYQLLDTAPDPRFDRLTRLARDVFEVPMAFITLIDERRQWFKSRIGLELPETARDIAICAYTIQSDRVTVVRDTLRDPRFVDNPLVTGAPAIRFYAGSPLVTPSRHRIGTFAVADTSSREFGTRQRQLLEDFAALAMDALELWRSYITTDEKQAGRIAAAERRLRESERLEALGRLAGGIAHDFNNLLTVILGNASVAHAQVPDASELSQFLSQIQGAAERGALLTRQVLAFARRQVFATEVIDINALVANLLPLLRRLVGEHIVVSFQPNAGVTSIRADAAQIEQALMNLCANARDALNTGGEIRLRTERVRVDAETAQLYGDVAPGPFVALSVEDTGQGMDPHVVEHAFDPFFSTKKPGRGTGLGLSIVHGITRQHGGFIELDSAPERGTRVRLLFPSQAGKPAEKPRQLDASQSRGGETILLAEDNDLVREVAARILRDAGYDVIEAHDGSDAVARLAEARERVDLVILDLLMPGLGGLSALQQIQVRRPGVRYLLATGYASELTLPAEHERHLLAKPYDRATLLRRLREELDR